jgi:hypothetical protein
MKNIKITTIIILITSCFALSCSNDPIEDLDDIYIHIADSHFETNLIEQGIDSDGIVNQQMLKSDAEKVTKLNLNLSANFGQISNLIGIEGFTNITSLSADGQKIKNIDLSYNTKLDTIYLNGNLLTTIDISNNLDLVLLEVQANELRTINGFSSSEKLKYVNLSFNNFEEISIDNESIEVLYISHNLLKTIDTNEAVQLKNILIIQNLLTTVDFSANTLLETLVISGNKLQNLNLDYNTSLTHLFSSSNLLTNLDVSNNHALIDMRVDRNPDLSCIKIESGQNIPTISLSDYQELNEVCN